MYHGAHEGALAERFNRYMVECEWSMQQRNPFHLRVLIDTWWNVNYFGRVDVVTAYRVLIDTWWNVNTIVVTTVDITSSFNRYMVECEFGWL